MNRGFHFAIATAVIVLALIAPARAQVTGPEPGVITALDADNGRITVRTDAGVKAYRFEKMRWTIKGKNASGKSFKAGDKVRVQFNARGELVHVAKD